MSVFRRSAIWISALTCGLSGFGLAAGASTALATEVTAQITGKWSDTVNVEWEAGKTATYTNTTTWAESFDGTYWSYSSFKGEVSQSGTAPEPSKPDCSGQLSLTSASPGSQTAGEGGDGVGKVTRPEGTTPWEVQAFVPFFSSATYGGHEQSSSSSGICATQNLGTGYWPTEAGIWEPEGNALGYVFAH
ncbi:MAG TPA: hypothetical protein VEJ84_22140, partial [Acidimicrobiales bacterium]|nr:hypothetical protein [Acidimicrobiales bacterium]